MDPTRAFEGLAEDYASYRPDYPAALFARLTELFPTRDEITALDVGAGTGISSRALARAFAAAWPGGAWRVIALEPGGDMRREAQRTTPAGLPISFCDGSAEQLPLPDGAVDLVLTAQAAHWFDRPVFYREVERVLAAGGWLAIANNNRRIEGNAFMADYEDFLETYSPRYGRRYRDIDFLAELGALFWAGPPRTWDQDWQRSMTAEAFVGLARSSSKTKAAIERHGWPTVRAALAELVARHTGAEGLLEVPYVSALQLVRKAS